MFVATKTFKFEGAHVLDSSYSEECQNIHGHSYVVKVALETSALNKDGMVMDFKKMKELVNPVFDKLDHALIISPETNTRMKALCPNFNRLGWNVVVFTAGNPTAENMAKSFYEEVSHILSDYNVNVAVVEVAETRTGSAEYWEI